MLECDTRYGAAILQGEMKDRAVIQGCFHTRLLGERKE